MPPLVLPLCQVGVFSPSHRNHYLNVTPNNLLRVYSPDGFCLTSTPLLPLVLVSRTLTNITFVDMSAPANPQPFKHLVPVSVQEPMLLSPIPRHSVSREPVSRMQLLFDDDEDDVAQESEGTAEGGARTQTCGGTEVRPGDAPLKPRENSGPPDTGWGLGESPCVH